eukprot:TRINITY_DN4130_c0_g2_i1.p1 TRINITY_DN4130_c0_g2~~TRINITY_DN4130_c0_g2_i1.p1  ORF type:complete len:659 (+),score=199.78 TRINITY_DN4130_c0_g2_i1:471-2447(+)
MLFPGGAQFGHQCTFENATPFWLEYAAQDCEYGWNALDADGKISGTPGGAWIQSNETHFLRDGCVWKSEWNAYVCPTFAEGYAQITFKGSSTQMANPPTGSGITKTGARTIRGLIRPLGSTKTGPKGQMQGDGNGQLMHNVISRRQYAVEFYSSAGLPATTPSPLRMNIQSSNAGDWIIIAIPYPAGTTFSEVVDEFYPNVARTQVSSIADLTHLTYFFDTTSNHLHLLTYNSYDGSVPTDVFGQYKVSDGGGYKTTRITASCGSSCNPTLAGIPKTVTVPKPYQGEPYVAILNGKQSLTNANGTNFGKAFFFFHPNAVSGKKELHYKIYHDVPGQKNVISIKEGAPGVEGVTLSLPIPVGNTAAIGILPLTRREWEALASGSLYVSVATGGKEVIRGRIVCNGACTKPPKSALKLGDVCKPTYGIQTIYSNDAFPKPIIPGSWDATKSTSNYANPDFLCGNSSWALVFSTTSASGASWWSTGSTGLVIDSKYKSIEFFVKTPVGKRGPNIGLNIYKEGGSPSSTSIDVLPSEIDNFVIDDLTWARVRVSLTRLALSGKPRTIYIYNHWTSPTASLLIDEFRFSTEEAAPITELADITIPQASDIYAGQVSTQKVGGEFTDYADDESTGVSNTVAGVSSARSISASVAVLFVAIAMFL